MSKTDSKGNVIATQQCVLKSRPTVNFDEKKDCEMKEDLIDLDDLKEDEVVVQVHAIGVDAFIRVMLNDTTNQVHGKVELGSVIPASGFGTVVKCGSGTLKPGTWVSGLVGAQTHAKLPRGQLMRMLKIPGVPNHKYLNLFSISGLTAHVGMYSVAKPPRKGETVVVSAAAGATGSIAAQLAKLSGARVIGIAGGKHKTEFLTNTLGLDGAIDYQDSNKSLSEQLKEQCPNGIDFYYDNVGGATLNEVLLQLAHKGRIVLCGAVSQYGKEESEKEGPSNYIKLAEQSATMAGFVVIHYPLSMVSAFFNLLWLYARGKVQSYEHVYSEGIHQFPAALQQIYESGNPQIGKPVIDLMAAASAASASASAASTTAKKVD